MKQIVKAKKPVCLNRLHVTDHFFRTCHKLSISHFDFSIPTQSLVSQLFEKHFAIKLAFYEKQEKNLSTCVLFDGQESSLMFFRFDRNHVEPTFCWKKIMLLTVLKLLIQIPQIEKTAARYLQEEVNESRTNEIVPQLTVLNYPKRLLKSKKDVFNVGKTEVSIKKTGFKRIKGDTQTLVINPPIEVKSNNNKEKEVKSRNVLEKEVKAKKTEIGIIPKLKDISNYDSVKASREILSVVCSADEEHSSHNSNSNFDELEEELQCFFAELEGNPKDKSVGNLRLDLIKLRKIKLESFDMSVLVDKTQKKIVPESIFELVTYLVKVSHNPKLSKNLTDKLSPDQTGQFIFLLSELDKLRKIRNADQKFNLGLTKVEFNWQKFVKEIEILRCVYPKATSIRFVVQKILENLRQILQNEIKSVYYLTQKDKQFDVYLDMNQKTSKVVLMKKRASMYEKDMIDMS